MVGRFRGTKARHGGVDQAEGEPASDEGEGTAVWLSMLLREETC